MKQPSSRLILGSLSVAALLLLLALIRPSNGQPQRPAPQQARYQVALAGDDGKLVVIDTFTGRCWAGLPGTGTELSWRDLGTPVKGEE